MIDIDKLKGIKHLVTHANCPDGIASALIVKDALPDVRVSFMLHGSKEHRELEPEPGTLFCDFTPYVEWLKTPDGHQALDGRKVIAWVQAGAVVLDHHPTAKTLVDNFALNGLGVFGENVKNECGAWLAYEHVWKPLRRRYMVTSGDPSSANYEWIHHFAELAAIRDTWKREDPRWQQACQQAAELIFWGFEHRSKAITAGGIPGWAVRDERLGQHLLDKQLSAAQRSLDEAHYFQTTKGTRVCVFQGVSTTSDAAELFDNPGQVPGPDLVVGFHYKVDADKLQLQFSTRSHTGYDCAAFAKSHPGGGGHKAAAGFTVEVSPELSANPYQTFRLLLEQWEGR